jgi:hypothetical protein
VRPSDPKAPPSKDARGFRGVTSPAPTLSDDLRSTLAGMDRVLANPPRDKCKRPRKRSADPLAAFFRADGEGRI